MNALVSFFQQSRLVDACQSLMGVMHGKESLRSSREAREDAGYHNAFFASQTWSFVQTDRPSEDRHR